MSQHQTCPDWRALAERRDAAQDAAGGAGDAEVAWERALAHLDACGTCFDDAVAAEPTLLFRRLPRDRAGEDDVAAMKRGVAALVRAHEIEHPPRRVRGVVRRVLRPGRAWLSAAAAALALGATLLVSEAWPPASRGAETVAATVAEPPAVAAPAAAPDFGLAALDAAAGEPEPAFATLPLYEDLGAAGEMIQLVDHDRDILVFVGDDLDV